MWQDIARFGRKVVTSKLSHSHFGNISIRVADKILITRSGSMLDEIGADQVVEVGLFEESSLDILASSETPVHRAIYRNTSALAIIHTHSPYAVTLSLVENGVLKPVDSEGAYFLHKIPVVEGGIGTGELAKNAAEALREHKACIARGHGVFVVGRTLEEAFVAASMAEHSLKIRYLLKIWGRAH